MDHIETKILNSYTIQEAAQNMVFAARLTVNFCTVGWGRLAIRSTVLSVKDF